MAGLMIQVNGKGMIPRGYGLAPRKEPFLASDIHLIYLILNTAGLSIKFVNPKTNQLEDLTKKNMKKMWDMYADYKKSEVKPQAPVEQESQSSTTVETVQEHVHEETQPVSPTTVNAQNVPIGKVPPVTEGTQTEAPAETESVKEETKVEDQSTDAQSGNKIDYKNNKNNKNNQNNNRH